MSLLRSPGETNRPVISSLGLRPRPSPALHMCSRHAHTGGIQEDEWENRPARSIRSHPPGLPPRLDQGPVLAAMQGRFQTPHWGAPLPPERPPGRTVQQTGGPQCFLWVRSTVSSDGNTHTRTMNHGARDKPSSRTNGLPHERPRRASLLLPATCTLFLSRHLDHCTLTQSAARPDM